MRFVFLKIFVCALDTWVHVLIVKFGTELNDTMWFWYEAIWIVQIDCAKKNTIEFLVQIVSSFIFRPCGKAWSHFSLCYSRFWQYITVFFKMPTISRYWHFTTEIFPNLISTSKTSKFWSKSTQKSNIMPSVQCPFTTNGKNKMVNWENYRSKILAELLIHSSLNVNPCLQKWLTIKMIEAIS